MNELYVEFEENVQKKLKGMQWNDKKSQEVEVKDCEHFKLVGSGNNIQNIEYLQKQLHRDTGVTSFVVILRHPDEAV